MKNIATSGQYFMPVSLMTHIPHYPVIRCIKDIMKRHRQFHHTQTGSQMSGILRNFINNKISKFLTNNTQFTALNCFKVIG